MIKQYVDYKMGNFERIFNSTIISPSEKKKAMDDYSRFMSYFKFDEQGRPIITKKVAREMMKLVREGVIPYVIDEYDIGISIGEDMPNASDYEFQNISDFVAVHKTKIMPSDDMIMTPEDSGKTHEMGFVDPSTGTMHSFSSNVGNDTIHFTLNCAVCNHDVGNDWDSYEYAVMIGLDKLDRCQILDVKSEDTFLDGSVSLGNDYYIFCPVGQKNMVLEKNPNATIIEYSGIPLNEAISRMIIYSGKKLEPYGTYGWGRDSDYLPSSSDNKALDKVIEREGYPNLVGVFGPALHSETKYMSRRMWKREYYALISLLEYNKNNGVEMPDDIVQMILMYNGAYAFPGTVPVSVNLYKEYVIPLLEEHGYQIGSDFFDGIDTSQNGMKIINHYPSDGMMVPCVQCPEWENELRNRVIKLIKEKQYGNSSGKIM